MNKIIALTFILIFTLSTSFSQTVATASTGKIGPFKLEMFKKDAEQIISQKIHLSFNKDTYQYLPVTVNNNGVEYFLYFVNSYSFSNADSATIFSISTKDNRVKTLSGLGVGNTKTDLLNTYSDKYDISIFTEYEENKQTNTWVKVPGKRRFSIVDAETGAKLSFILANNIVSEIVLEYDEQGD